jgi:hypothetical protein
MGPIQKIQITVNIKMKNGSIYTKTVETEIEDNKLRSLGSINGSNNLNAVRLLFGNLFIGEEIISYHSFKQVPK